MSDAVKVKVPFVISLSVKGFLLHILQGSHLSSPLQTRLKCNLYPRQPSAGRSPDKIMRLKRENIHLKIKFTIHIGPVNKLAHLKEQPGAGESRFISRHLELFVLLLTLFYWFTATEIQAHVCGPRKLFCSSWRMRTSPMHTNNFQPLPFPAKFFKDKSTINIFNSCFRSLKYCPLLLRAGFHLR